MSLVNEMLRNLDRRDGRPLTERRDALPLSADEPKPARPSIFIRAVAAAALVAVVAFLALTWRSATPAREDTLAASPNVAPLPMLAMALPLPDAGVAPIALPPTARVERLALAEIADGTRLSLDLSRETAHRLERSADGREVELRLEDAELGVDLPHLELRGAPVERFEAERVDGDLRIRLTTSQPVSAHSIRRAADSAPGLELDLRLEPTEPVREPETEVRAAPTPRTQSSGDANGRSRAAHPRPPERGDERDAESRLRESLERTPSDLELRSTLVALLLRAGRLDAAQAQIEIGRSQPGDASAYAALAARALLARGNASAALLELERDPPALTHSPEHHALLAAVRERLGRHAAAAETYRSLLTLDATRAEWWLGLALAREGEGQAANALAAYRLASRLPGLGSGASRWVNERVAALSREN